MNEAINKGFEKVKKVLDIAKAKQEQDFDSVFGIVGDEGGGKSTFGLCCDDYLGCPIGNIAFNKEDVTSVLRSITDKSVFHFDEAGDGLFSRESLGKFNKELVKCFMVIRAKRLITFLVLPDFFLLDLYFREHRIRGLFHVYRRGKVKFYDKKRIQKLNHFHRKFGIHDLVGVNPAFSDTFPNYKGMLWNEYIKKKAVKVQHTLDNFNLTKHEKKHEQDTLDIGEIYTKTKSIQMFK